MFPYENTSYYNGQDEQMPQSAPCTRRVDLATNASKACAPRCLLKGNSTYLMPGLGLLVPVPLWDRRLSRAQLEVVPTK